MIAMVLPPNFVKGENIMREYTNKLTGMIDDGLLSSEYVLKEMLSFFAESDIEDFCKKNDSFGELFDEDEDEDE